MKKLFIDFLIVTASVYLAVYLFHLGAIEWLINLAGDNVLLVSLLAGVFFTSFFTTPPAIAVFAGLGEQGNIFVIALVGALGSVLGDSLIFFFVREHVAKDAASIMSGPRLKRILRVLRKRRYRRILPVLGALIIASPIPDEIGLALIGVSTLKRWQFFILSYAMNALGILSILLLGSAF
jgi:uncharacterized membrane protein YdjX (TVP38/TMEM64 family)